MSDHIAIGTLTAAYDLLDTARLKLGGGTDPKANEERLELDQMLERLQAMIDSLKAEQ